MQEFATIGCGLCGVGHDEYFRLSGQCLQRGTCWWRTASRGASIRTRHDHHKPHMAYRRHCDEVSRAAWSATGMLTRVAGKDGTTAPGRWLRGGGSRACRNSRRRIAFLARDFAVVDGRATRKMEDSMPGMVKFAAAEGRAVSIAGRRESVGQ